MTESSRFSFPWRTTAAVAGIVVAASIVAGFFLAQDRVETAGPNDATIFTTAPDALPVEKQRQVTVLLAVRDVDGRAVSTVLIGVGGDTGFVSELMLPRSLVLPSVPSVLLKDAGSPTGPASAEQSLETLLGVQVDAALDLDRLGWAGLIDATGTGVDRPQTQSAESFPLVVDRVLSGLPADDQTLGQLLTGLGSMARTNVPNDDVSHLLAVVGEGLRTLDVRRETLPVAYVRAGVDRASIALQDPTAVVVAELFPRALLKPGHAGQRRVVLQRAGATLGAATSTRLDLVSAGFGVLLGQEAAEARATTAVLVPDSSEASLAVGRDVADALGLSPGAVVVDAGERATVDVRIVLGADASAL